MHVDIWQNQYNIVKFKNKIKLTFKNKTKLKKQTKKIYKFFDTPSTEKYSMYSLFLTLNYSS